MTKAELKEQIKSDERWSMIRSLRNKMLDESDVVVLRVVESGVDETQEWKNYRQTLRDIPQDYEKPEDVIFPSKPK